MRTRFTWIVGVLALVAIGALVACSSKYSSTNNGLIVASTQADLVMETFSLDLGNGHVTPINNVNGPPTPGVPTTVVLDPAADFAYVLLTQSDNIAGSSTGVATYSIASDGKLATVGSTMNLPTGAVPTGMVMDSAGKFLFVTSNVPGQVGTVSVFSSSSSGALTEVSGSPFPLPLEAGGQNPVASALAITPTIYPPAYALCSGSAPPTTEYLYVTDSINYMVVNYSVGSSGVLSLVAPTPSTVAVPTGTVPSGVTVDPCNRFVYVTNGQPNNSVSGYTICRNVSLPTCPDADFSLQPIVGSPFAAANSPGPLVEDAYANYLYVVDTGQNAISAYRISTTTGALTPLSPTPVPTNLGPTSISVRGDDSWLFVSNITSANISEYAITPSTGGLTPQPPIQAFPLPWGVAVK